MNTFLTSLLNRFHSTWDRIQQTFWAFIKLFRWHRERQQNKVCIFYLDNCKWNSKKHFTVFWSFNLFYFRILDSVIMSAVIDPPPKVLPENVTLVFKNMQVYTLLFRYVYSFFNWIGVFLFLCLFVCFLFLFYDRETPIVHSFLIWVTMLSSFPSVETKFWWLAHNLKTARDLINKWALHPIWLPAIF